MVVSRPSTGSGSVGADVREHERPGAVRVLRHARREARLPEQRGLLIAGDAAHRHAQPGGALGNGHPEPAARRQHLGQARAAARRTARTARPTRRRRRCRRASCGSRSTGRSRARRRRAAGEVPEQPRVDGAEHEVVVGRRRRPRAAATRASTPRSTGRARARWRGGSSARGPRRAARRSVRPCAGPARRWRGARGAPVRRSQTTTVSRWFVMPIAATVSPAICISRDDFAERLGRDPPDVVGVVLDPARAGEVLRELAVRARRAARRRRRRRTRARRWCPRRSR